MTEVVNIYTYRTQDLRNYAYIGRAGRGEDGYFGNPFLLDSDTPEEREKVLALYSNYFYQRISTDPEFKRRVGELKGKTLVCFCAPKTCHGNIIAEYLDQ